MQVTLNAATPAETRLIAAFLNDLADLQETGAPVPAIESSAPTQAEATAAITQPKKTRAKKETPAATVTEPDGSTQTQNSDAAAAENKGNESATTAEPANESGSSETAEAASKEYTTDDLRTLFGAIAQKGRRDKAVKVVRSYGFNGISEISADKLNEVGAELQKIHDAPEEE